jgi:GT2 family glycosyltransferase
VTLDRPGADQGRAVVVAVLTYRGIEKTRACLDTLRRSSSWPVPTLIVDSASGTGEGAVLATDYGPPVVSETTSNNDGVPGGYNEALRWAAIQGATHVLLLNNDTLLDDADLIAKLFRLASPDVAALGPWVRDATGSVQSAGGRLRKLTGQAMHLNERSAPSHASPYSVDWLDGSCLLVSVDAARDIGGLAPEYFLYWEEVDWCVRAARRGYRLLVDPNASITHLGSQTVTGDQQVAYWMRNKLLFARRNAGLIPNLVAVATLVVIAMPRHALKGIRSGRGWRPAVRGAVGALRWNVADAIERGHWRVPAVGPPLAG